LADAVREVEGGKLAVVMDVEGEGAERRALVFEGEKACLVGILKVEERGGGEEMRFAFVRGARSPFFFSAVAGGEEITGEGKGRNISIIASKKRAGEFESKERGRARKTVDQARKGNRKKRYDGTGC
jgi:hypothetical protein